MYLFPENEISTLEIESEMKFSKHIKVKPTKKLHKNNFFLQLTSNMFVEFHSTIFRKHFSFFANR